MGAQTVSGAKGKTSRTDCMKRNAVVRTPSLKPVTSSRSAVGPTACVVVPRKGENGEKSIGRSHKTKREGSNSGRRRAGR